MRKVLLTGGSRGIGKAIADKFIENGYEVFAPTRLELELSSERSIEAFLDRYRLEGFDVIINNAGINEVNLIENITDEELQKTIEVNLLAPIRLLRGLVPAMKAKGYGRIVNIGSIWGIVSKPGRTTYAASKHAIHGLTNTLAVELAPFGILVNTVSPGFTMTELTRKNNTPEEIQGLAGLVPMGRIAEPEEIAAIVYMVASAENTYMTGQQICVDGGFTSR